MNTSVNCKNCGHALQGRFCSHCGQAGDVHVPSTHELMHEVLEGLTHSDSRLWRTLVTLWFKPGKLTTEFIAGRRMAYLPPFRLYLIMSVIFFLSASFTHPHVVAVNGVSVSDLKADTVPLTNGAQCEKIDYPFFKGHPAWKERAQRACRITAADNAAGLFHGVLADMPKAMFVLLPLVAALHMLLYWRPRHRYAEHLLFFLHVHAQVFSVLTLMVWFGLASEALPSLVIADDIASTILLWSLPVYVVIALRRVFGRGWANTLLKAAALIFIYMVLFSAMAFVVFAVAYIQQ